MSDKQKLEFIMNKLIKIKEHLDIKSIDKLIHIEDAFYEVEELIEEFGEKMNSTQYHRNRGDRQFVQIRRLEHEVRELKDEIKMADERIKELLDNNERMALECQTTLEESHKKLKLGI